MKTIFVLEFPRPYTVRLMAFETYEQAIQFRDKYLSKIGIAGDFPQICEVQMMEK